MNYAEWLASVPAAITDDVLWRTEVYRVALFLGDLAWYLNIERNVSKKKALRMKPNRYPSYWKMYPRQWINELRHALRWIRSNL